MSYTLPPLAYDYAALEPHIDARTMEIHYSRHHQTYVNNLNAALEGSEYAQWPLDDLLAKVESLPQTLRQPRVLASFVASAFLLSANWFIYIWAVNNGHVVDASLGYFITPLINVMLGFLLLHERLRRLQWLAIGLAACGVAWLTWQAGQVPWIALLLAASFGGYGLLRKTAALGALEGLSDRKSVV